MNCLELHDRLDDFLDGKLGASVRAAVERHLDLCSECRELTALLRSSRLSAPPEPPPDFARAILGRTSGSPCRSARKILSDYVDALLPADDAELMRVHLESCGDCGSLSRVLARLGEELPGLAELDPGPRFVDDVLEATLSGRRWPARLLASLQQGWSRLLERPRLAMEGAYVGSLVLLLVFGVPGSPLAAVPKRALEIARTNPVEHLGGEEGPVARLEDRVSSGVRSAWQATGHRVASTSTELAEDLSHRYRKAQGPRRDLRRHGAEALDAALDADGSTLKFSLDRMGHDLSALWKELTSEPDSDNPDNEAESRC